MRVGHSAKPRERWHDIRVGWLVGWLVDWLVDLAISVHRDERYIEITRVQLYTATGQVRVVPTAASRSGGCKRMMRLAPFVGWLTVRRFSTVQVT